MPAFRCLGIKDIPWARRGRVSGDLRIPDVAAVSDYALTGSSVTSVHVPETVRMIGREALSGPDVAFISVDFANRLFSSVDGVLFDHTGKVLIQAPCAMNGGYAVPDPVTDIGESAFKGCGGLVSVTIPGTVDSIGADAFKGTGLTEVVIGDGPIAIDPDAFQGFVFLIDEGADRPLGMDEIPGHRYTGTDGILYPIIFYPASRASVLIDILPDILRVEVIRFSSLYKPNF